MSAPNKEIKARLEKLRFAFGQIRRQADAALEELDALAELLDPRCLRWRCDGCGFEKLFTKPAAAVACDTCPKCKGAVWSPVPLPPPP